MGIDSCRLCPRVCGVDRTTGRGFCGASADLEVASVCLHRGEEPPLNPIVNVFFAHCNLQCIYCQNWQISKAESGGVPAELDEATVVGDLVEPKWHPEGVVCLPSLMRQLWYAVGSADNTLEKKKNAVKKVESIESLTDRICATFSSSPAFSKASPLLGFVTAAHYAHHIAAILDAVHQRGIHPTVVYNSGGYESVETLRSLEGLVDIYLPDFKYIDSSLAASYSHAPDYPEVATAALREMIRQVGSGLKVDDQGIAYRGLIVRHLVLPGHVDNSLAVLDHLADMVPLGLRLSLMAQYFPPRPGLPSPLDRPVTADEYAAVVAHAEDLGLTDGWIQELAARDNYRPDFNNDNPFEN